MLALIATVLLAVHLLCMNASSGLPIVCVWLARRSQILREPETRHVVLRLALYANWALLCGAVLGLLLGLVAHHSGHRSLAGILPYFRYKIGWALIELQFSAAWMFAYWAWLRWSPPRSAIARWTHGSLAVLSATNLLYHFPMLLTVMSKAARGDLTIAGPVNAAVFRSLAFRPEVLAHSVHFGLASIAVSGLLLFWLPVKERSTSITLTGARFALGATVLQIPTGMLLVMSLPPDSMNSVLGGQPIPSVLLVASVLSVFYLLQNLAAIAFGEVDRKLITRASQLMFAIVLLMSGTLHFLRQ